MVVITQPEKLRVVVNESGTTRPFCPDWANGVLSLSVTGGTRDYSFTWEASTENDSVISNIREGWYDVTISDAQGCSMDSSFHLKALNENCLNIPTAFTPNDDEANNYWEIRYMTETGAEVRFSEVYQTGEMKIYDRLGNLVYHCSGGCPEDWNGEDMHGRRLPVDSYYYILDLNNGNGNDILKGIVTIIR
jgi:gliding motility-associated-like protein